jgi:hypothetical protein
VPRNSNKPTKKGISPKYKKGNKIANGELPNKSKLYVVLRNGKELSIGPS